MKTCIVWFKTNLRLHDNETLVKAIASNDEIIPVYCLDESHFTTTKFGFKKTGNFRIQFLLETLQDLDKSLRALGSGLLMVTGKPEVELVSIAQKYSVQKVYAQDEVAYEEIQKQKLVERALLKINCQLETHSTRSLYHPLDLPFEVKDTPDVFTNFRKSIEQKCVVRDVFLQPTSIHSPTIEAMDLPSMEKLGATQPLHDLRAAFHFKGGETEGLKRLHSYLFETKAISSYKETRNGMIGENYSSKFSAWLSMGCLSAKAIYHEIKEYEKINTANQSTYWLVFELLWRDFFIRMMVKHGHHFFLKRGIKPLKKDLQSHRPELLNAWINGETGNHFIDANMQEIKLTGFMSNRGRQNVSSYLCNELAIDWRYGAAYFEQQLIDYDVCSNWGNWAYVAGVGNDPRGHRIFNIEKQASDYDKDKSYRNLWLPQYGKQVL